MGLFITFEGTDGSGKTTQIELLYNYLKTNGYDVVKTREPGGTIVSEQIRNLVLDDKKDKMDDITEMLLFAASRIQHVKELIYPSVNSDKIVITDRFLDSSLIYQGYGRNIDISTIEKANSIAIECIKPDITFFLTVDPKIGIIRKKIKNRWTE